MWGEMETRSQHNGVQYSSTGSHLLLLRCSGKAAAVRTAVVLCIVLVGAAVHRGRAERRSHPSCTSVCNVGQPLLLQGACMHTTRECNCSLELLLNQCTGAKHLGGCWWTAGGSSACAQPTAQTHY